LTQFQSAISEGDHFEDEITIFNLILKQIKKIKEKSQELMEKVIGHRKEVTNEVEASYNNLMLKRNELQKVQSKLNHLIQNSHVAEKVKQRKEITKILNKIELDEPTLSEPQVISQTCMSCIRISLCYYHKFRCKLIHMQDGQNKQIS